MAVEVFYKLTFAIDGKPMKVKTWGRRRTFRADGADGRLVEFEVFEERAGPWVKLYEANSGGEIGTGRTTWEAEEAMRQLMQSAPAGYFEECIRGAARAAAAADAAGPGAPAKQFTLDGMATQEAMEL